MTTVNCSECGEPIAISEFPIGINFQSKEELETFAQSIIAEVQNPVYAFNSFKCFRLNRNINLSVWEMKNLSEDKFPITIIFKDKISVDRLACSYYREKFQAQPDVCDVPTSPIPENNDDDIEEEEEQLSRKTGANKYGILLGSVVAVFLTVLILASTDWDYHHSQAEARKAERIQNRENKHSTKMNNVNTTTISTTQEATKIDYSAIERKLVGNGFCYKNNNRQTFYIFRNSEFAERHDYLFQRDLYNSGYWRDDGTREVRWKVVNDNTIEVGGWRFSLIPDGYGDVSLRSSGGETYTRTTIY